MDSDFKQLIETYSKYHETDILIEKLDAEKLDERKLLQAKMMRQSSEVVNLEHIYEWSKTFLIMAIEGALENEKDLNDIPVKKYTEDIKENYTRYLTAKTELDLTKNQFSQNYKQFEAATEEKNDIFMKYRRNVIGSLRSKI